MTTDGRREESGKQYMGDRFSRMRRCLEGEAVFTSYASCRGRDAAGGMEKEEAARNIVAAGTTRR